MVINVVGQLKITSLTFCTSDQKLVSQKDTVMLESTFIFWRSLTLFEFWMMKFGMKF